MSEIRYAIINLREQNGMSQQELADKLGKTRSAVSQYESGKIIPKMGVIEDMAEIFGVKKSEILGETPQIVRLTPVPLYGSVAAGVPIEMIQVEEMKEAPARYVDDDPNCFLVKVVGNSMNRHIQDADFALVSPKYNDPNDHDMFLVTVNGDDATIKHVRKLANGVELLPDSYDPTYRPKIIDFGEADAPPVKVLGKVVWWCAAF